MSQGSVSKGQEGETEDQTGAGRGHWEIPAGPRGLKWTVRDGVWAPGKDENRCCIAQSLYPKGLLLLLREERKMERQRQTEPADRQRTNSPQLGRRKVAPNQERERKRGAENLCLPEKQTQHRKGSRPQGSGEEGSEFPVQK